MATQELFVTEPYTRSCTAKVTAADGSGIRLDRTLFYPEGGGQPGDTGYFDPDEGRRIVISDTQRAGDGEILHIPVPGTPLPEPGTRLNMVLDWERRHRHMRMHTCLHLLSALVKGAAVTGGAVHADRGRLDFDLPENILDKEELQRELDRLIRANLPLQTRWITQAELAAQPELVRTMSVKPPSGPKRVRLVEIEGVDLQPCGGTHLARTGEIGEIRVDKIEKKGRQNRRVNLSFAD